MTRLVLGSAKARVAPALMGLALFSTAASLRSEVAAGAARAKLGQAAKTPAVAPDQASPSPTATATDLPSPTATAEPTPRLPQTAPRPNLDRSQFPALDRWADLAPSKFSLPALTARLVKPARNETEKARVLFRWITRHIRYDTKAFFSGRLDSSRDLAESTYQRRRAVCEGYAVLFHRMASLAGLESAVVHGTAKGYGHEPGEAVGESNHAWNAVKVRGRWRLLDCTWGAGRLDDGGSFVRDFEDFYFLPAPEHLIFSHFPEEPKWQLLEPALGKQDFAALAEYKGGFFSCGLNPGEHPNGRLRAEQSLDLAWSAPGGIKISSRLSSKEGRSWRQLQEPYSLDAAAGDRIHLRLRFPAPGSYKLEIFAGRNGRKTQDLVATYRVEAGGGGAAPFPQTFGVLLDRRVELLEGCTLDGQLKAGSPARFRLKVPGAKQVAAISPGNRFSFLTAKGDGVFDGELSMPRGKVMLAARFGSGNNFAGLLEYRGE